MANPPKKPGGTTPPRRKAASRKATPPVALPKDVVEADAPAPPPAVPKKPAAKRAPRAAAAPAPAPKPRVTKRPTPPRAEAARKVVNETRERIGDRNFFAAVLGATAALGAAIAGVFLASRSRREPDAAKPNVGGTAHQPDGTDSTASFEAAIADEHTIPDKLPD